MARKSSASIGIRLVDEAYVSWCMAQMQCQTALREWFDAGPRDRAEANSVYRAPSIASRRRLAISNGCRAWRTLRDDVASGSSGQLRPAHATRA
jgi:hypothetical protein